jgi:hypothetical protein
VDPAKTLTGYLLQSEKSARKRRVEWSCERDLHLVGRGGRDVSSIEGFHWRSELEAYGVIWYSPSSERVTVAQVNGPLDEPGLKTLAKRVLGSLRDAPAGALDLWTAFDLECRVPRDFILATQSMETGHTEMSFTRGRHGEALTISRWGLASIALERVGDLGDWAWQQRYKTWHKYSLEREATTIGDEEAIIFRGRRTSLTERVRWRVFGWLGQRWALGLTAVVRHCPEANAIVLVEHQFDPRQPELALDLSAHVPGRPPRVPAPKG